MGVYLCAFICGYIFVGVYVCVCIFVSVFVYMFVGVYLTCLFVCLYFHTGGRFVLIWGFFVLFAQGKLRCKTIQFRFGIVG